MRPLSSDSSRHPSLRSRVIAVIAVEHLRFGLVTILALVSFLTVTRRDQTPPDIAATG